MTKANLKRLEEGKLYYSISEVCTMTGLEQHVLRYWESEFPQLRPKKNRSGNRAYRTKEIKIVRYIKYLLYEEMYTIPGAKKKMADMNMADLDGQLTLLRVPANPVPVKEAPRVFETAHEAAAPMPESAEADYRPMAAETAGAETAGAETAGGGDARADAAGFEAEGEDSHARDGGEAAARLREELRRVKQELQELLSALAAHGKGAP
jgi:DNA-binding transcriptional MerR regulator